MPQDERADRCHRHHGQPAVAACDDCGVPLCILCAIPVRGRVLGVECLGMEDTPAPAEEERISMPWAGVGFALAVVASMLPWRRYGLGSGAFGAWGTLLRWSLLSGVAALAGLIIWVVPLVMRRRDASAWRWWRNGLRGCAIACFLGALLHLVRPPMVGPQSYGALIAMAGAVVALAGTFLPRAGEPDRGVRAPVRGKAT